MKANEFIKINGLNYAKERIEYCKGARLVGMEIELKRLVESHDICKAVRATFGGYDKALDHFLKYKVEFVRCTSYSLKPNILAISKPMLNRAIADVESCQ